MKEKLSVKCPTCAKTFYYYTSESRPFCGERCKMVDLGKWFDESYAVSGKDGTVYVEKSEALLKGDDENY